ncbi:Protein kinase APK1A, chloroplastic [Hordeum vulgare]|nr:Protein kinase APK1A, chloroplastic [Hordeum vulgare]
MPRGRHNSDDRRQWWGVLRRMLHAILEHIEGSNEPPLEYLASSLSRRSGSSWLPMRMVGSSSSHSSDTSPSIAAVDGVLDYGVLGWSGYPLWADHMGCII